MRKLISSLTLGIIVVACSSSTSGSGTPAPDAGGVNCTNVNASPTICQGDADQIHQHGGTQGTCNGPPPSSVFYQPCQAFTDCLACCGAPCSGISL